MQFLWSPFLWSLALVPLLIGAYVWLQRRRGRFALRYASLAIVKPAVDKRVRWRRYVPPALFFGALAIMLVALARPVALVRTPRQEGTVILAVDSSISMRAEDVKPNRLLAAIAAARTFIDKRGPGAQIGIVAFGGDAAIVQQPTDDVEALNAALDQFWLQRGTAIGSGILASLDAIALGTRGAPARGSASATPEPAPTLAPVEPGTYIPSVIVLLTDGQNRNGPDPIEAAKVAAQDGVRIYTVGVGSREGGVIPRGQGGAFGGQFNRGFGGGFRAELDETTLKAIADTTGGQYFYAASETALDKIYSNLGLNIVLKLEKVELTAWFTAVSALLLFSAVVLSMLWSTFN